MSYPTHYQNETPEKVKNILESLIHTSKRVRLFYGDTEISDFESTHDRKPDAGLDWGEEYDITGTIGKSTGIKPIPLMIANSRSLGGGAILDDCIVRILVDGREVYRHPNYHNPLDHAEIKPSDMPEYTDAVYVNDKIHARFHSHKSAVRWLEFMQGKRMTK